MTAAVRVGVGPGSKSPFAEERGLLKKGMDTLHKANRLTDSMASRSRKTITRSAF